jgi:hypothetical protein
MGHLMRTRVRHIYGIDPCFKTAFIYEGEILP